jgi:hypothetical protein
MEQWTSTEDTRVAAAMGNLGVVIRLHRTLREKTGVTDTRFHLSLINTDGDVQTKRVLALWRKGRLEKDEPAHPFLTGMRAQVNRELLLDCANKGTRIRLVKVPGTEIWQYVRGGDLGLPGVAGITDLIETGDLKIAAALGLVGIPVVAIQGARGDFKFYLPRYGPVIPAGQPADGVELRAAWYRDKAEIPWQNVFAQGIRCLFNRERVLDAVNRERPLVLLEKPRSVKGALVHIDATDEAFDEVKRAFERP